MRMLVTGAGGFVGGWLVRDLESAGHHVVKAPPRGVLDLRDSTATRLLVQAAQPDAVAHLAAISFPPDAARDPDGALSVSVHGTISVYEAVASLERPIPILISGSSDVYGNPSPTDLPLREGAPLDPKRAYGRSKLEQEHAALRLGAEFGLPTVVTRSFNHTGPGQRPDFVVPALAAQIVRAASTGVPTIRAGNVDVRRDIGDVRDVVRAYRLLLELASRASRVAPIVANVCTGHSTSVRDIISMLADLAGVAVAIEVDPKLVRADDPAEIVGDNSKLHELTGWSPTIPLAVTLADVIDDARRRPRQMHSASPGL